MVLPLTPGPVRAAKESPAEVTDTFTGTQGSELQDGYPQQNPGPLQLHCTDYSVPRPTNSNQPTTNQQPTNQLHYKLYDTAPPRLALAQWEAGAEDRSHLTLAASHSEPTGPHRAQPGHIRNNEHESDRTPPVLV